MSSIPLFIGRPLAPSMTKALTALEKDGFFTTYPVPFDADVLRLMIAARPCAAVFSISNEATYQQTFKILDHFKRIQNSKASPLRDPALRMILLSEHWAVQLERWMEVGVHEFIPAPISQKALVYKLNRHYAKAVAAPLDGKVAPDADVYTTSDEITLIKDPGEVRGPLQAFYIPGDANKNQPENYEYLSVWVGSPEIIAEDAQWQPATESSGFDETWMCLRRDPKKGEGSPPTEALLFTGDRPSYDTETKRWLFRGEAPRLVRRRLDRHTDDEVIITSSSDREKVFIKDPDSFEELEVLKRSSQALRQLEQPVKVFLEGEFTEAANDAPVRPAHKPEEAAEVEKITEFLEKWEPKDGDQERAPRGTKGQSETKPKAPRRPTKASEEPLPGFYSGPGHREDRTGYTKSDSKSEETPSQSYDHEPDTAEKKDSNEEGGEQKARQRKTSTDTEETGESGRRARTTSETEKESRDRRGASLEEKGWRDLRQTRHKPGGEDDDPRAKEKTIDEIIEKLRPIGAKGASDKSAPRDAAAKSEKEEPPEKARRRSSGEEPIRDRTHRLKGDDIEAPAITGRLDANEDVQTGDFADRTDQPQSSDTKIDGGGSQADDVHRFAPDETEGADTWSMQNEGEETAVSAETPPAPGTPAGASPLKAPTGKIMGPPIDVTTGGAPAGGPSAAAKKPKTETAPPPKKIEEPKGWLEKVRRVLERLFS